MSVNGQSVITSLSLRQHFFDELASASRNQDLELTDLSSVYVVNLLTEYSRTQSLKDVSDGTRSFKPLAILYAEALSADCLEQRNRSLQRLGDLALFISGLFANSLARKAVDIDYYIGMGEAAYLSLEGDLQRRGSDKSTTGLFNELAIKFAALVDVLGEIGESCGLRNDCDTLRAYEIWLRTGSPRARKQLERSGIVPLSTNAHAPH